MRTALVLLTLLGLGGLAIADAPVPGAPPAPAAKPEAPPPAAKPVPPPTPEHAANAVLAAVKAKDDAALKALAVKDDPDPWLVADELIRRGEHDAADAFAKATPRVDVEKLPEYVASRRGKVDDAGRRARIAAANSALAAGKPDEAVGALGAPDAESIEDLVGVRLATGRGFALSSLLRHEASAAAFLVAGEAAEKLGWLVRASRMWHEAGACFYRGGRYVEARDTWERQLAVCERRADRVAIAATLGNLGRICAALSDYESALSFYARALAIVEDLGNRRLTALLLGAVADIHTARGEYRTALPLQSRAVATLEELGEASGVADRLHSIARIHVGLGDFESAMSVLRRALAAHEALRDRAEAANVLSDIGGVQFAQGNAMAAMESHKRALAAHEALGNKSSAATTLGEIGNDYYGLGEYESALATLNRALTAKESLGDKSGAAATRGNIGTVLGALGEHARALGALESAFAAQETLGNRARAAGARASLGLAYRSVGDPARALRELEGALTVQDALGAKGEVANTLNGLGLVYLDLGDNSKAVSSFERAIAMNEAIHVDASAALGNLALAHEAVGDHEMALAVHQRALVAKEARGDRVGAARTMSNIGNIYEVLGDHRKALSIYERALAEERATGDRSGAALTLGNMGIAYDSIGEFAKAADSARHAVRLAESLSRGLGAEEGSGSREPLSHIYEVGARAAASANNPSEMSFFVESGRARALLAGMAARSTLWTPAVPERLRRQAAAARIAEASATGALRKAIAGGDPGAIRLRSADLDLARARVSDVIARIQREVKAGASLIYPEAATLDEIQATLAEGDAMVLYALTGRAAFALAVTKEAARIVELGPSDRIEQAAGLLALDDVESDPTVRLAALSSLLIEPLSLPTTTKRLLVSPMGSMSYIPIAALATKATVSYVASGTTYRTLREGVNLGGEGVLALGDPDYQTKIDERALAVVSRGSKLIRLLGTRAEAKSLGTVVLLGSDASEAGFADALAKRPRWRAVHFACHGIMRPDQPTLSSLALTATESDDGFLSALEVFRMKVPADLVVMSACETGKGKVYKTEGIVGLTRAFMFAGAPRVICSLWKVDDAATKALMVKFYELWNPKDPAKAMGTAAALKAAQEYVRTFETEVPDVDASQREGRAVTKRVRPWEHPYYWAAWVLWGLPS